MDTKIDICILSIFLKLHNILIILTVISAPSILSTRRNLHWKSTIHRHDLNNVMPFWLVCTTSDVISVAHQLHHRLNGSSSPVLTATSLSYGKVKNSTPPQNQNPWPDWDKIWQGWLHRRGDPSCKIYANPSKGSFPANGWNIRKNFSSYPYTFFFRNSPTGQTLRPIFARDGSNDAVLRKHVPFGG